MRWDGWAHKPGLTHQRLVHRANCGTVYVLSIANSAFSNWAIVGMLKLFYVI